MAPFQAGGVESGGGGESVIHGPAQPSTPALRRALSLRTGWCNAPTTIGPGVSAEQHGSCGVVAGGGLGGLLEEN